MSFDEHPVTAASALAPEWWALFGSAPLNTLIAAAQDATPDLAIAAERVRRAEAQVRIADAVRFPSVNFGIGSRRIESRVDGAAWQTTDTSGAALSARYEVDQWNKNVSGLRAAEASLRASRLDHETVRLALVAGVANNYFQLLSLRGRLANARDNQAIAERVLKLVESRVRNGAASAIDLARQQAAVLTQSATIPPLQIQERQVLFALANLLGRAPEGFAIEASSLSGLSVPRIEPGLPSQLLVRRPDVASAEAQLAAANANVAVARAGLLPSIALTGSSGLASDGLINLLSVPTATLAIGVSLLQPIFDGGRQRGQVDIATSRERELVASYRKAVLTALTEVEGSLAAGGRLALQERLQELIETQAREALRLAEIRYRGGADDQLSVLDAQRTLFQAQDQRAGIRLSRLQTSVGLFKALGGSWQVRDSL
jgi:NodT family efflux transporter outer membrane factor (OMF) lipoprotein